MDIALHHITKYFAATVALDDVTLEILPGELVAVRGANGAGKSTVLRTIAGVSRASSGSIYIEGVDLYRDRGPKRAQVYRDIGSVLAESYFYRDLTLRENLEVYLRLSTSRRVQVLFQELTERFSLAAHLEKPIRALSHGLVKRGSIVRALLGEPRLLVLDEPFAHLDSQGSIELSQELVRRHAAGVTIVVTGHTAEIVQIGPSVRTIEIDNGRIIENDTEDHFPEVPPLGAG